MKPTAEGGICPQYRRITDGPLYGWDDLTTRKINQIVLRLYKWDKRYTLYKPRGFQEAETPRFQDNQHTKVVTLPATRNVRLYLPQYIPGTNLCWRMSVTQCHGAAGRITSTKKSNDTNENRTRDLPACSAVTPGTAKPRAPPPKLRDDNIRGYQ